MTGLAAPSPNASVTFLHATLWKRGCQPLQMLEIRSLSNASNHRIHRSPRLHALELLALERAVTIRHIKILEDVVGKGREGQTVVLRFRHFAVGRQRVLQRHLRD